MYFVTFCVDITVFDIALLYKQDTFGDRLSFRPRGRGGVGVVMVGGISLSPGSVLLHCTTFSHGSKIIHFKNHQDLGTNAHFTYVIFSQHAWGSLAGQLGAQTLTPALKGF